MNKTRMNIFFILIKKTKGYIIWVFHNQRFLIELPLIDLIRSLLHNSFAPQVASLLFLREIPDKLELTSIIRWFIYPLTIK